MNVFLAAVITVITVALIASISESARLRLKLRAAHDEANTLAEFAASLVQRIKSHARNL